MPYTDLIQGDDLHDADPNGAVVSDLLQQGTEAASVIGEVSRLIEAYLGYDGRQMGLIVRRHTQEVGRYEWHKSEALDAHTTWADQQPVVQLDAEDEDLSDVTTCRTDDRKVKRPHPKAGTITYFGGYRRPDQVLSAPENDETELPTDDGEALDGLTTLPPEIPGNIRMTAVNITLHVLQNRAQGHLGRRTQQTIGNQQVTIEGADPSYVRRQLGGLDSSPARRILA